MPRGGRPEQAFRRRHRELLLLVLLAGANGVVALDRLMAAYLSPYLADAFSLTNAQLGLLAGALSIAVSVSSLVVGWLADITGRHKAILVGATLAFSFGSGVGGLATGFGFLLVARFALGLAEGPMVPVSQSVMAAESDPTRRGFNMGVMQMSGAFLLGGMLGPIIATQLAAAFGWRTAFFLSALPGAALALALAYVMQGRRVEAAAKSPRPAFWAGMRTLLRIRNIRLAIAISALFSGWLMAQNVFLPLYLTRDKGLSPVVMGWVLSMGGLAGLVGGLLLPLISDRVGRVPVCAAACFAGMIAPLVLLLLPGEPVALAITILLGWLVIGIAPLYCAVIPSESAPAELTTVAIGLSMAAAELIGGVIIPYACGRAADAWGLAACMWICALLAVAAGCASLFLVETAPRARAPSATRSSDQGLAK